MTTVYRQ